MPRLLNLTAPLLAKNGRCFFFKGAQVETELTAARRQWQMVVSRHDGPSGGCILEVTNLHRI